MKNRLYLLAIPVMLALVACRPGAAEYTEVEAPKLIGIDSTATQLQVAFAGGSARLAPGEAVRLQRLGLSGAISRADRVTIAASGDAPLRARRIETISSELLRFGIVAVASPLAGVPRNRALIAVGRDMVTLPPCPNWSKASGADFTNTSPSNFGCATTSNLALMVASPGDLVGGRELGPADGRLAAAAMQRYVNGIPPSYIPQQFDGAAASPGSIVGGALSSSGGGGGTSGGK
jgi:pilus assembly protein CpaD